MSKLVGRGIVKNYSGKNVLNGLDIEIESGRIYGLIGRNGAGKTTLLSILTAQCPETAGEISLDGQPVWENRESLKRICFSRELNQMVNGYPNRMRIRDYLDTAAAYLPGWDEEMCSRLVQEFGLDRKQRISKLSKGMLSMVTIIVALASKAEFTFLDEPVAGLDVIAREKFYGFLMDEYTETGRTFVISTHIIEEAENIFEDVIILDHGQILLKENTEELKESFLHVSGAAGDVDAATAGLTRYQEETLGRSKGVTVRLGKGQYIDDSYDLDVKPMGLQRIFVALCGEEAKHE